MIDIYANSVVNAQIYMKNPFNHFYYLTKIS